MQLASGPRGRSGMLARWLAVHEDGTVAVRYDDGEGDEEDRVSRGYLRPLLARA